MATFPLGRVVATPGALKLLEKAGEDFCLLLARHRRGDWGKLDPHDRRENKLSLKRGWRILSSYPVGNEKVWIIPRPTDPTPLSCSRASTDELLLLWRRRPVDRDLPRLGWLPPPHLRSVLGSAAAGDRAG